MSDPQLSMYAQPPVKWGWFVGLGILLLLLGTLALANLFLATIASVFYIGALMLVAGAFHIIHASQVRGWQPILYWAGFGVLYLLAGILTFTNPMLASAMLTLFLGAALVAAGVFRLWAAFKLQGMPGAGWLMLGGLVTLLAGVVIALGWPVNSLWILGLFLSIDLLMQGWGMIALGFGLKPR
jgi:uncharacterized membrane protein HdeD (DUF308 family)